MPARSRELENRARTMDDSTKSEFLSLFFKAFSTTGQPRLITVDGRARAGKDTLTGKIGKETNTEVFSLGVYSRALTWVYLRGEYLDINDPQFIEQVSRLKIEPRLLQGQVYIRVFSESKADNLDVTLDPTSSDADHGLRSPKIGKMVTQVSAQVDIVKYLNTILYKKAEQAYQTGSPFVSQGRDHYNIFPRQKTDIDNWHTRILMVFLSVSDEKMRERVKHFELNKLGDNVVMTPQLINAIEEEQHRTMARDYNDSHRLHGRLLKPAEVNAAVRSGQYDAVIDTTFLTEEQVLLAVACLYLLKHGIVRTIL